MTTSNPLIQFFSLNDRIDCINKEYMEKNDERFTAIAQSTVDEKSRQVNQIKIARIVAKETFETTKHLKQAFIELGSNHASGKKYTAEDAISILFSLDEKYQGTKLHELWDAFTELEKVNWADANISLAELHCESPEVAADVSEMFVKKTFLIGTL